MASLNDCKGLIYAPLPITSQMSLQKGDRSKGQIHMNNVEANREPTSSGSALRGVDQEMLKSEISFWQEMIRFRDITTTDETLERMQQALALAQSRLKTQENNSRSLHDSAHNTSSNVFFIKQD